MANGPTTFAYVASGRARATRGANVNVADEKARR